ncbi:MAG: circularly permuted type 2 ATP-grasp protein, partial [Verrucomicrobiota bacterium]
MDSDPIASCETPADVPAAGYRPQPGRRDEAVAEDRRFRHEWRDVFAAIQEKGADAISDWRGAAARLSWERGLAYRPASLGEDQEGWTLDPIPWVFSAAEWATLTNGIAQRLHLYERLLRDLYGDQRTMAEGIFPAEIILRHQGYLRALHDFPSTESSIGLGLSAFDIARDSA